MRLTHRLCAVIAAALSLAGCSSSGGGTDYQNYVKMVRQSMGAAFGSSSITLQQAAQIPYATMGWRLNNGGQNLIILATDTNGEQLWTSAAHVVIVTQNGLVKRTVGLPHDLAAMAPHNSGNLTAPATALQGPYTDNRIVDLPDLNSYGVAVTCRGHVAGRQSIKILGKVIATTRVDEDCNAPALSWSFRNSYWLDPENGFVWRASESVHPRTSLQLEIFRPPS